MKKKVASVPMLVCQDQVWPDSDPEHIGQPVLKHFVPTANGAWAWLRVLRTGNSNGTPEEMMVWANEERVAHLRLKPRPGPRGVP